MIKNFSDQKLNLVSENDLRGFAHHIGHLSNLNISHFWNQSYQLKHWHSRGKENVLQKNSEKMRIINCFSQCHSNIILIMIIVILKIILNNIIIILKHPSSHYHLPQNLIFFAIKEISCTLLKNFPLWASPIVRLTGASDMDLPNYFHIFHQKEKVFFLWASSLLRGSTQN